MSRETVECYGSTLPLKNPLGNPPSGDLCRSCHYYQGLPLYRPPLGGVGMDGRSDQTQRCYKTVTVNKLE